MAGEDEEFYVLYLILGDGIEHVVELASPLGIEQIPYTLPSESYWMVPIRQF